MGVTLFEMLNGPIEWDRMDMSELMARLSRGQTGPVPRLMAWEPHIPRDVIRLVRKATVLIRNAVSRTRGACCARCGKFQ